jgi:hypothetical protein
LCILILPLHYMTKFRFGFVYAMWNGSFTERSGCVFTLLLILEHSTTAMRHLFAWQMEPHAYGVEWRPIGCDVWSQLPRTSRGAAIHVIASSEHRVGWVASLTGAGALCTRNADGMRAQNSTWLSLSSYFIRFSVESNKAGEVEVVGTVFYRGDCLFHTSITIGRVKQSLEKTILECQHSFSLINMRYCTVQFNSSLITLRAWCWPLTPSSVEVKND